jgi:hypothetical protein
VVVAVAAPVAAAEVQQYVEAEYVEADSRICLIEALAALAFRYLCQPYKDNKLPELICCSLEKRK